MDAIHRDYWEQIFQSLSKKYIPPVFIIADMTQLSLALFDAPFTAYDFYWAIKTSLRNKAPEYDGHPVEYYQLSISPWARGFDLIYPAQLSKGRMTKFQRRATVTLLYKKGLFRVQGLD